jgi:hypothetical protein
MVIPPLAPLSFAVLLHITHGTTQHKHSITLYLLKVQAGQQVKFAGCQLNKDGDSPLSDKVDVLKKMSLPSSFWVY